MNDGKEMRGALWELICYHTYILPGIPVDLSDYDSSGRTENLNDDDFASAGVTPDSGIVRFPHVGSRIRIKASRPWDRLVGLCVDVTGRFFSEIGPDGGDIVMSRTLIAGHGSFKFRILEFKELSASIAGDSIGLNSRDHSPDGLVRKVPLNQWVRLRFVHDGISTAQLFIDDKLVAQRRDIGVVIPPVRSKGISIGNDVDREDRLFREDEIDEVKVWRLDPNEVARKFLSRPLDPETAECWEKFTRRLNEALARDPECQPFVLNEVLKQVTEIRRSISAQGPEALDLYAALCREYERFWKEGKLDGPEMKQLFQFFCEQLQKMNIRVDGGPLYKELSASCLSEVLSDPGLLECDPKAAALVHLIANACAG